MILFLKYLLTDNRDSQNLYRIVLYKHDGAAGEAAVDSH